METRMFLVPDYFDDFHCKCGQCRHTCCDGWPVTFSRADYFHLLSVPCSPELRRKLDTALHLTDEPTPERYAELLPNWEGHCPLQSADGLCGLQRECGEGEISTTCRYYPRGFRTLDDDECACSASCEQVVELLMQWQKPMGFHRRTLNCAMPLPPRITGGTAEKTRLLRQDLIQMMQVREKPLANRLLGVQVALVQEEETPLDDAKRWQAFSVGMNREVAAADWPRRTMLLELLIKTLLAETVSTGEYAAEVLPMLQVAEGAERLKTALAQLEETDAERWMEQLMVNHIFYEGFPYSEHVERPKMGFVSLCATYAVLKGMAALWQALHPEKTALVDVLAACFRVMEHSPFGWNAAVLLTREGMAEQGMLEQLAGM